MCAEMPAVPLYVHAHMCPLSPSHYETAGGAPAPRVCAPGAVHDRDARGAAAPRAARAHDAGALQVCVLCVSQQSRSFPGLARMAELKKEWDRAACVSTSSNPALIKPRPNNHTMLQVAL